MKRTLLCAACLALFSAAMPFLCLLLPAVPAQGDGAATPEAADDAAPESASAASGTPAASPTASPAVALGDTVPVYDAAGGQTLAVAAEEFLVGAAACEMPVDWPDDAILAQMVASRSYALSLAAQGQMMQADSALCSGWTTAAVLQSRWGSDYETNLARLQALAARVTNAVLLYDGSPAAACYHAVSSGHTESSEAVWGGVLPYLCGVDSAWDKYADGYEVTVQYSADQVRDALGELDITPQGDADTWLGSAAWDAAGYVSALDVCGQAVSGTALRRALGLRSACFAIAWRGGQFVVTTRGYGHGVGLSQYGAKAMAEGGAGWRDILLYYFPGCEIADGA